MKNGEYYRMQKQELILRFFAFQERVDDYTGSLATFLNDFMEKKRFAGDIELDSYRQLFKDTSKVLYGGLQALDHKGKISVTLQDAMCFGVGKNINALKPLALTQVASKLAAIIADSQFSEASLAEGLAKKQRLIDRMKKAEALLR